MGANTGHLNIQDLRDDLRLYYDDSWLNLNIYNYLK
jgi:hypothetical protein